MSRILNYKLVTEKLQTSQIGIFSVLDFERIFGVSKMAAQKFLAKYANNGTFTRIKNGLYYLSLNIPSEMLLANKLYEPSYISFEYALNYYGIIPESIYVVTSATTKATRNFTIQNKNFTYNNIRQELFFGYMVQLDGNGQIVYLAEPEKALADYLYFVNLGEKKINDRLDLRKINKKRLFVYLKKYKRSSLIELAKKLYA